MKRLSLISGKNEAFDHPLPVGQLYFPSWERYESVMRGIFDRQYYNNNGPLVQEFEARLAHQLNVKHAICVGNATFGLMMVIDALGIKGRVLLPSFSFIATAQSVSWCGATPVFCDIDYLNHQLCPKHVEKKLCELPDIKAIMAVNLWGGAVDIRALERIAKANGLPLIFDSAHAFGCKFNKKPIGGFGIAEVFSFHATKVLSAAEGGCVTTNNDTLAAKIRGIRPSYDPGPSVAPFRVLNSRMSEAQAGLGLLNLDDYPSNKIHNKALHDAYLNSLAGIKGIQLILPPNVSTSNYQYAVCVIKEESFGLTRDQLLQVLEAENVIARRYFYPGIHRSIGFTEFVDAKSNLNNTEELSSVCLQLPLGDRVEVTDVVRISEIISQAQTNSGDLAKRIPKEY